MNEEDIRVVSGSIMAMLTTVTTMDRGGRNIIMDVINFGSDKHGQDPQESSSSHLVHAIAHAKCSGFSDPESHLPHRAHEIARILLALYSACDEFNHDARR